MRKEGGEGIKWKQGKRGGGPRTGCSCNRREKIRGKANVRGVRLNRLRGKGETSALFTKADKGARGWQPRSIRSLCAAWDLHA